MCRHNFRPAHLAHVACHAVLQVKTRGDIIAFYNQCFVPHMKQFLLDLTGAGSVGTEGRPPTSLHLPRPPMPLHHALPAVGLGKSQASLLTPQHSSESHHALPVVGLPRAVSQ